MRELEKVQNQLNRSAKLCSAVPLYTSESGDAHNERRRAELYFSPNPRVPRVVHECTRVVAPSSALNTQSLKFRFDSGAGFLINIDTVSDSMYSRPSHFSALISTRPMFSDKIKNRSYRTAVDCKDIYVVMMDDVACSCFRDSCTGY